VLQNYSASAGNWLTQLASGWPDRTEEKKLVSKFGYKVINRIADVEIPKNTGDFRLMSRRMVDQISSWIQRANVEDAGRSGQILTRTNISDELDV